MAKLVTLTSAVLLLTAGCASAQNTTTSGRPVTVLTPDQCNQVWSKAVAEGDTRAQADAAANLASLAQVDDFAQVDVNNDGTVDRKEFEAACGKGLLHAPPRAKG